MQDWNRSGKWSWESGDGYRIAAMRVRGQFLYMAYAPPAHPSYGEFSATMKLRYERGESVPQFRESLGCFDDAAAARAGCEAHAGRQAA